MAMLPVKADAPTHVKIRPMVLLSVLDHYTRRPEGQTRVIGTLLGWVTDKHVEVVNSFAVPHSEKQDEVAVGQNFNRTMAQLHARVNSKEVVVGWYATSANGVAVVDSSSLIHEFYSSECENPVHLVVDTSLAKNAISANAYISTSLQVDSADVANIFHQVKVSLETTEEERICLDRMLKGQETAQEQKDGSAVVSSEMSNLELSMQRLLEMLESASDFVDGVVNGEEQADDEVGRRIADTLAAVPRIRPEVFDRIFNNNLQDLLMVSYLSCLTKTQLSIAAKLNESMI